MEKTNLEDIKKSHYTFKNKERIKKLLINSEKSWKFSEIAEKVNLPLEVVVNIIEQFAKEGKNLEISKNGVMISTDLPQVVDAIINIGSANKKHYKFGVIADNHLASKYSRLDVQKALYKMWKQRGIKTVYQLGNIIDGEARFNKHDLLATGIEGQINYLINEHPHEDGITTEFITGDDHEGWYIQREGINIGQLIEDKAKRAKRYDLKYLAHMEYNIELKAKRGSAFLRLMHGGGGSAYATSYTSQKYVESLQGGEKPNIVLIGHFHKFDYGYPREVYVVQPGCVQDQTPFMRKKKLQAMVGGVTLEFDQDEKGLIYNVSVTWHPFYDRSFYKGNAWKYHFGDK